MDPAWRRTGLFDCTFEGLIVHQHGVVLDCNGAAAELLGYPVSELVGKSLGELLGTDETTVVRKDGALIPVAARSRAVSEEGDSLRVTALRDLSAQKRSEQQLRASEQRLRVLLGCTQGVVLEFDRDARYVNIWTDQETLLARPRDQLLGHTINDALGIELGAPFTERVQRILATGRSESFDYELNVQDGRRWFSADGLFVPALAGALPTVVFLIRDATAKRQLEGELHHAQKMEAIGQLAGGVAHDFNNILMTVIGYGDLLMKGLDERSPLLPYAEHIARAARRASTLTRQLLAYSRKQVLKPERVDVSVATAQLGHMMRRLIGEHIEIVFALDPDVGEVLVDPGQLEQVLWNLVLNARDAMPDGGQLILRSASVTADEAFCARVPGLHPGRYVELEVRDTGCGMDAATQAHLFEPFFTTKGPGKGTGLGLSSVYGIVKQSGGHITVASTLGAGTAFRLYLPQLPRIDARTPRAPVAVVKTEEAEPAARRGAETLLVAEDEEEVRDLVAYVLRGLGYRVLVARDGQEALELARGHTGAIDLLLTDVVMPRLSGHELARQLHAISPATKIIFMSGHPRGMVSSDDRSGVGVGAAYLQKPFTARSLAEEIGEQLRATAQ